MTPVHSESQQKSLPLWSPSQQKIQKSALYAFIAHVNKKFGLELKDYWQLYRWSIEEIESFWREIWSFCQIQSSTINDGDIALESYKFMDDFPRWFPNRKLNFTKNLLYPRVISDPNGVAVYFRSEVDSFSRSLTWKELREQVFLARRVLVDSFGVVKGDRIAAYAHNCPETLIYMLAGASIGAIFTAGSPDFGATAIVDRFSQTEPKVLLSCNAVFYNGKVHDHLEKLDQLLEACKTIKHVLVINYIENHRKDQKYLDWTEEMMKVSSNEGDKEVQFEEFDFDIPLYIVYSSGTTGKPKCIVHGAGGSLLQHVKEHLLHGDMRPGQVLMQYTTIGWMMWQWMVSSLAVGASVVLYDGSPFRPDSARMWSLIDELGVTHFGTSAKYLQTLQDTHFQLPVGLHLQRLQVLYSTGSPLPADMFRYVYGSLCPSVQLASITGGTDILSLFAGGCPMLPVHAGEIQVPCLGMAIACDSETDSAVTCGDLVCKKPFPSQPVAFWLDDPIAREKYRAAYFADSHIWRHGDFFCFVPATGGLIMLGRSDGTLNPAGVRFGSADLYAICGKEPWIEDSLAVGVKLDAWKDEQVFLFLLLKPQTSPKEQELRDKIRTQLSPRHVPAHIHIAPAIPHTLNGKKVEVSVKRILNGNFDLEVLNLANPESITFYREFAKKLHTGKLSKL